LADLGSELGEAEWEEEEEEEEEREQETEEENQTEEAETEEDAEPRHGHVTCFPSIGDIVSQLRRYIQAQFTHFSF